MLIAAELAERIEKFGINEASEAYSKWRSRNHGLCRLGFAIF